MLRVNTPRHALPMLLTLLAAALAIWPSWPPLFRTWLETADYQHGWFVALIIVAWLYAGSARLPPSAVRTARLPAAMLPAALLLAALLAWLIAFRAVSYIGQQILIPPILWLAVWTGCGWEVARRAAPPLACLYFAIPVWDFLVPGLQHLAAQVTETVLGWLGVPVSIEGTFVTIPEGSFHIAEGCAGKRYLIVALTVAGLLAGTRRMRPRAVLPLLAATALLALLANWLRIMIVIYAGHLTDMQSYLVTREHLSLGWALFALLIAGVCVIGTRLAEATPAAAAELPRSAGAALARPAWRPLLATAVLLAVAPVAQLQAHYSAAVGTQLPPARLPQADGAWRGPLAPDFRWSPYFRGTASSDREAYRGAAGEVQVYLAQYQVQSGGAKLVSFDNRLFGPDWVQLRSDSLPAPSPVAALWVQAPTGERWLISYVYQVGDVVTASPILAQLAYGTLSWRGALTSRLLAVAAPCGVDCQSAQQALASFWASGPRLLM